MGTLTNDGHRHLAVVPPSAARGDRAARFGIGASALAAAALFGGSYFLPWWRFWLYAPQYPGGLRLVISLTGMGGDVSEIDLLNHYIGMAHLAQAAPVERRLAAYGVAAIAVVTVAFLLATGRRLRALVVAPALAFPLLFLADSFYWLYRFGHHLDPRAPLHIGVFTPQLFGNGQIGQFETFARPELGFWVAVAGVAAVVVGVLLRSRVCGGCARADRCGVTCPRVTVLPDRARTERP